MEYHQNRSADAQTYLCRFTEILDEMIKGMTEACLTDSISHNFISQMIPHHEAAIQMSRNILRYTTLEPLREIASDIIRQQTKGIEDMRRAFGRCGGLYNSQRELCLYQSCFRQISQTMFCQMRQAPATGNLNADFMREMIPHHEGAIRMSNNALRFCVCPELGPILKTIIVSQERGVREMEALLRHC